MVFSACGRFDEVRVVANGARSSCVADRVGYGCRAPHRGISDNVLEDLDTFFLL